MAAWETSSAALLDALFCAAAPEMKPKRFTKKRLAAKRVTDLERLQSLGQRLNNEEATMYRALAAHASYLMLGKPEATFATKEL